VARPVFPLYLTLLTGDSGVSSATGSAISQMQPGSNADLSSFEAMQFSHSIKGTKKHTSRAQVTPERGPARPANAWDIESSHGWNEAERWMFRFAPRRAKCG
jgi:hypothetical protein